jgi:hypothetical protein
MRAATGFEPSDKWFGQQAVYRISMGNFLFFGAMSLALLGVRYKGEKRGQVLQQGNWMIKLVAWVAFMALPFFFPNGMVQAYGASRWRRPRVAWQRCVCADAASWAARAHALHAATRSGLRRIHAAAPTLSHHTHTHTHTRVAQAGRRALAAACSSSSR